MIKHMALVFTMLGLAFCLQSKATPGNQVQIADLLVGQDGNIWLLRADQPELFYLNPSGELIWKMDLRAFDKAGNPDFYRLRFSGRSNNLFLIGNKSGICELSGTRLEQILPKQPKLKAVIIDTDREQSILLPNSNENRIERYARHSENPSRLHMLKSSSLKKPKEWDALLLVNGNTKDQGFLNQPYRVDAAGDCIWVLDKNQSYKIFDLQGRFVRAIMPPDFNKRAFVKMIDLECDATGIVYVASGTTKTVFKYNQDGVLQKEIGLGPNPNGFAIGSDGELYVGDSPPDGPTLIRVIDQSGRIVRKIAIGRG